MGLPITTQHDCMILDACCVMNLYASGKIEEIISSITETVAVTVYVMKVEALTVYKESKNRSPDEREVIDLQPLIDKGCLAIADFESDEERFAFIEFAGMRLDDGEAATLAIASKRNWAVATDDRAAQRVLSSQYKHIQILSTPQIIYHWQQAAKPEEHTLFQAITLTEQRANYLVGRRHPLFDWWQLCKKV